MNISSSNNADHRVVKLCNSATLQAVSNPNVFCIVCPTWNIEKRDNLFPIIGMPATAINPYNFSITISTFPESPVEKQQTHHDAKVATSRPGSTLSGNVTAASASLGTKLAGDAMVAVAVTFGVSPFLTVVDKAIVESAAGTRTLLASGLDSVKYMVRHPVQYFKSPTFLLMWAVYSATYTTANSFKTLEEHSNHHQQQRATSSSPSTSTLQFGKVGTFLGTTFVNSGASILKDRAYARMFSTTAANTVKSSSSSFPKMTYAMWMMRDFSVIGSSFILPDIVSQKLVESYGMERSKAQSLSQLTLPVVAQFVAGPFHFLGLDFYNRPNSSTATLTQTVVERSRNLYQGIGPVVAARIARIAPGYGIGGVWNTKLRTAWRERLVLQEQSMKSTCRDSTPAGNIRSTTKDYVRFSQWLALLRGGRTQSGAL
jgi:hypothetical protein